MTEKSPTTNTGDMETSNIRDMNNNFMSESIDKLALALSKAQSQLENVSKDRQAYGYKYADLASCLQAIKKPLADNGLSITQPVTSIDGKQLLITLLLHESGQWLKSMFNIENVAMKQCNSLQQLGAGITYMRRYALSAIIGLAQEDDDGQSVGSGSNARRIGQIRATATIIDEAELEDPQDKTRRNLSVIKELIDLCKKHSIDIKEFTKFHKINSQDVESVKKSIVNFELMRQQFLANLCSPSGIDSNAQTHLTNHQIS